jgi:hypothetical protein
MRVVRGKHECANCGAPLDLAATDVSSVVFRGGSGQPNVRVIVLNGTEIHRCEVTDHLNANRNA